MAGRKKAPPLLETAGSGSVGNGAGKARYANGHRRREIREWLASQQLPCHICGASIDYSLEWWVDPADGRRKRHPLSFEVDEIVPVSKGGSPTDRLNVAPAHRICNQRRGNKDMHELGAPTSAGASGPMETSREW